MQLVTEEQSGFRHLAQGWLPVMWTLGFEPRAFGAGSPHAIQGPGLRVSLPVALPGGSLTGGGGLVTPCWEGVGEAGGGGAGPLVGVWPPGEGACLLLPRELCRCGKSGAASSPAAPDGPLATR